MSTEQAKRGRDLASDQVQLCTVDGRRFLRIRLDDRTVLVSPRCPHDGTPMSQAYVVGEYLVCRRHGATFDLRTGGWVRGPQCGNITVRTLEEDASTTDA